MRRRWWEGVAWKGRVVVDVEGADGVDLLVVVVIDGTRGRVNSWRERSAGSRRCVGVAML